MITLKHLVSFARSPLGYTLNLLATLGVHATRVPGLRWVDYVFERVGMTHACEMFCLRDGVQDDMLF